MWDCVEPFDVDDGELDGLSAALCFALGAEWEMVRSAIGSAEAFGRTIHLENRERISAMLTRHRRKHRVIPLHDDVGESFALLEVDEGWPAPEGS